MRDAGWREMLRAISDIRVESGLSGRGGGRAASIGCRMAKDPDIRLDCRARLRGHPARLDTAPVLRRPA
jgi:hypothetical protein